MSGHCDRRASGTFPFIILGGGLDCPPLWGRAIVIYLNDPSKLACLPSLGRAAMLVYVRPSSRIPSPRQTSAKGVVEVALDCAHRTSTVLPCAFCEQEGHLITPALPFSGRAFREHRTNVAVLPILFIVRPL